MFFNRPDFDLGSAVPGTFALTPHDQMLTDLRRDYDAMAGMIFGPIPQIDAVVAAITDLERRLNARDSPATDSLLQIPSGSENQSTSTSPTEIPADLSRT